MQMKSHDGNILWIGVLHTVTRCNIEKIVLQKVACYSVLRIIGIYQNRGWVYLKIVHSLNN